MLRNHSLLTRDLLDQSDFVFPFFGAPSVEMLHGHYFLPLRDIPPAHIITERTGADFVTFSSKVLPITIICILVSILSGTVFLKQL